MRTQEAQWQTRYKILVLIRIILEQVSRTGFTNHEEECPLHINPEVAHNLPNS